MWLVEVNLLEIGTVLNQLEIIEILKELIFLAQRDVKCA